MVGKGLVNVGWIGVEFVDIKVVFVVGCVKVQELVLSIVVVIR